YVTNPSHTYTNTGTYNVVLDVENANGCKDTIIRKVRIYDVPKVNLTTQDICQYLPNFPVLNPLVLDSAVFTTNVIINAVTDTITSYEVDWQNDGTIDFTKNTSVTPQLFKQSFATVGTHNIMVKVSTAYCNSADTVQLKVYPNPIANFIVTNVCNDSAFKLIDKTNINNVVTGITPAPYVDSVYYNYGDNTTAYGFKAPVLAIINHKYTTAGKYPIVEMAKSNFGCINYFRDSVTIYPEPFADFTSTNVCFNETTDFASTSVVLPTYGSTNTIVQWQWDFNNNGTYDNTSTATPQLTILGADTNKLTKLVVTTNHGCTDTILKRFVIYPLPVALFGVNTVCNTFTSLFKDSSTYTGAETIIAHNWTFEPNQTSALVAPTYVYGAPNVYPVKLVVTTVHGCLDSITKNATVNPNPLVGFEADVRIGCEPLIVFITDTSSVGTVPPGSFNKQFDYYIDSTKHQLTNDFTYTFNKLGYHSIGLKVTTNKGCSDSIYQKNYIEVYPKPTAEFSISPSVTTLADAIITIVDKNKLGDVIDWNYGDDLTSQTTTYVPSHTHQYKDSGTYIITQYVTTNFGCKDTAYQTLQINPSAILFIPNTFTPNADGVNDYFNAKGYGIIKYELRIFDRWGKVVGIVTELTASGWDGNDINTGQRCKTEVYTWQLNYTTVLNEKRVQIGKVTLLK
ncbi:MAG: PKD domain-containing protein, partial [Bacteroidia bacterium]